MDFSREIRTPRSLDGPVSFIPVISRELLGRVRIPERRELGLFRFGVKSAIEFLGFQRTDATVESHREPDSHLLKGPFHEIAESQTGGEIQLNIDYHKWEQALYRIGEHQVGTEELSLMGFYSFDAIDPELKREPPKDIDIPQNGKENQVFIADLPLHSMND